jgi:hypothetical protein
MGPGLDDLPQEKGDMGFSNGISPPVMHPTGSSCENCGAEYESSRRPRADAEPYFQWFTECSAEGCNVELCRDCADSGKAFRCESTTGCGELFCMKHHHEIDGEHYCDPCFMRALLARVEGLTEELATAKREAESYKADFAIIEAMPIGDEMPVLFGRARGIATAAPTRARMAGIGTGR